MKKNQIKAALDVLHGVRMPKIEDRTVRKALTDNHLALLRANAKYTKELTDIENVHLGAYEEERDEVAKLQQQLQVETDRARQKELLEEVNSHRDLFEAVKACNRAIAALGEEEVDVVHIPERKLIDALSSQDWTLGWLDGLFPMLEDEETGND